MYLPENIPSRWGGNPTQDFHKIRLRFKLIRPCLCSLIDMYVHTFISPKARLRYLVLSYP